jgi:DNA invertase Pin-like site-specific DNA recombinase
MRSVATSSFAGTNLDWDVMRSRSRWSCETWSAIAAAGSYYYATVQEVLFANAIDQATTFIQGTGHQMELESIRSRTREALRSRVHAGRIAGGACYGYKLERKTDASGRRYTIAVVNEAEAVIVRRNMTLCARSLGVRPQRNAAGPGAPDKRQVR